MEIESKQQILERRKEIEQELVDMLKETDPPSPDATDGQANGPGSRTELAHGIIPL